MVEEECAVGQTFACQRRVGGEIQRADEHGDTPVLPAEMNQLFLIILTEAAAAAQGNGGGTFRPDDQYAVNIPER